MDNNFNFEAFRAIGGRIVPTFNIGKNWGVVISAGFTKKYDINSSNCAGVKFFFDRDKRAIGIKFLNKPEDGMVKIRMAKKGGAYINAKSFMIRFEIDPEKVSGKYPPKELQIGDGIGYVIELKEKIAN